MLLEREELTTQSLKATGISRTYSTRTTTTTDASNRRICELSKIQFQMKLLAKWSYSYLIVRKEDDLDDNEANKILAIWSDPGTIYLKYNLSEKTFLAKYSFSYREIFCTN